MNDAILYWNQVALDAVKVDFTSSDPPPPAFKPDQPGPTYAARALAIAHLAMYDGYFRVERSQVTYLSYITEPPVVTTDIAAAQAAVGAAACLTLIALFPRQRDSLLARHTDFMALLPAGNPAIAEGLAVGRAVGQRLLAERHGDGADAPDDLYAPGNQPYQHRADPYTPAQGYLGPRWGEVMPFGFENLRASLASLPVPQTLAEYDLHYQQVKDLGRRSGGTRTAEQTTIGTFWAYDGARNIGLPPRLYNQAVRNIVAAQPAPIAEAANARLFAMVNVALADAGIQAWHEKYRHNLWRPVVGIRESDAGWGPTGLGDGRSGTVGDPCWEPLGAPRTNRSGAPSFSPNFPAYPSGHATFGTAALRVVQQELGLSGSFAFKLMSDEYNGVNAGEHGVRPVHERHLTIDQAIEENILSRVYLGVHWELDGRQGAKIGEEIAAKLTAAFPVKA